MEKRTQDELSKLRQDIWNYQKLQKIAKRLHHQYENECNYTLTKRQETIIKNLEKKAQEHALNLGLKAYFQRDPRGLPIYLITDEMNSSNYNNGIGVY